MSEHNARIGTLNARLRALICGESCDIDAVVSELFEFQYEHCDAYRRICRQKQIKQVEGFLDVPAMPVDAFKHMDIRCFDEADTVAVFCTSGTTNGNRGRHLFDDLDLYRMASMQSFRQVFLTGLTSMQIVSLIPTVDERPDSSLSQMVSWIIEDFGTSRSVVDPTGKSLESVDEPVLILGTAIDLARTFESLPSLELPHGTRIMETGGFKGQERSLTRNELFALYERAGVSAAFVVGEYGMTELSSQWYDGIAGHASSSPESRIYWPAPWARTRVVDPNSMAQVEFGQTGLLLHVDPANCASVQAVLTSDLGERCQSPNGGPDGFRYVGRATGAMLRGCSLRSVS